MKINKLNQLIENGEVLDGHWELGPDHEVLFKCDDEENEIKFNGLLVGAEADALIISYTERSARRKVVTRLLSLAGQWKVNPKNQITFELGRKAGQMDALTFQGSWKVGDSNEIVYLCGRTDLKTKTKNTQELVFKGVWDISEKNCLTYYVGGDSNNAFRFRGTFQTKSIRAKKGEIRYQLGVEVNGRPKSRNIILFGRWIVSRDLNLHFEIEYDEGKRRSIAFGGTYSLNDSTEITVDLKTESGEPLGVELILSKDIFGKDGEAFIRLQKTLEESSVEAGFRVRF